MYLGNYSRLNLPTVQQIIITLSSCSQAEFPCNLSSSLLDPPVHLLLLLQHLPVLFLLLHPESLDGRVLLCHVHRHAPEVLLHVLLLLLLKQLSRVLTLLLLQLGIVLVSHMFPLLLLELILMSQFLESLLDLYLLLGVIHNLLQTHGESVLLEMLLIYLLLPGLSLPDFIDVSGLIIAAHHKSLLLVLSLHLLHLTLVMHLHLIGIVLLVLLHELWL